MFRVETMYAELHALTNFSFLRGASQPERAGPAGDSLKVSRALAITDECSLAGGRGGAHIAAKQYGLPAHHRARNSTCVDDLKLVALATDRAKFTVRSAA